LLSKGGLANSAFLHNVGKHLESKYHAGAVERMKNQRTLFDCGIATTNAVPTAAASLAHVPQKEHHRQADKKAEILANSGATGSPSSSSSSSSSSSLSSSSSSPAPDVDDGGVPSVVLHIGHHYAFSFFDDAVE